MCITVNYFLNEAQDCRQKALFTPAEAHLLLHETGCQASGSVCMVLHKTA